MLLRDYFAAAIVNALIQNHLITQGVYEMKQQAVKDGVSPKLFESTMEFPMYADVSYRIADAMLERRTVK
jgi:hypothetical protein